MRRPQLIKEEVPMRRRRIINAKNHEIQSLTHLPTLNDFLHFLHCFSLSISLNVLVQVHVNYDKVVFMIIASHVRLGKVDCVFVVSHGPRKESEW